MTLVILNVRFLLDAPTTARLCRRIPAKLFASLLDKISGAISAMGGSSSQPQHRPLAMEHPPAPYPDMNMIFKGIPKMMQVADDMHRMTDYIQDLRNMTLALGVMSFIGMLLFLLVKFKSGRRSRNRRRREDTYAQRGMPFTPEPWDRSHNGSAHKIDMEKMRLSQTASHHDFASLDHAQSNGGPPTHKKHEPVTLMVESLPYADSS
ncbi:hypothetical protein QR680_017385 [Steinernema hermaphroditum]|uniref:Uncharacterized protein n=1 Tax=Steinernema hermaphroditum TaxID=289476 RepID=A0AA39HGD3_9BILA|nr:hypothetical protein QR680_017385 [Steinernema hermaphroditum]